MDNAVNNDTFASTLEQWCAENETEWTAEYNRIRCFAHVINLAAQEALGVLKEWIENVNHPLIMQITCIDVCYSFEMLFGPYVPPGLGVRRFGAN